MRARPLRSRGPRLLLAGVALALLGACGGSGGGGGGPSTAQDLASVKPDPVQAAKNSSPGDFAADYLRGTHFTSILVEIDYPAGRPPEPQATALLEERLAERCDKPDGVTILVDDAIPADQFPATVTMDDLLKLESTYRDHFSDEATKTAVIYLIYVTGHSNLDGKGTAVLGLAYAGSSITVFVDAADQGNDVFVTTAEVEGTAIVHESGHLLGLVHETIPMVHDHEDPDHPAHDVLSSCVMYWLVQVPMGSPNIGDPTFAQFDVECQTDTAAFGGLPASSPLVVETGQPPPEMVVVGACPFVPRPSP